jgi:hypothetical protein
MKRIFAIAAIATLATAANAQDNNAASSTTSAAAPAASSTTVAAANGQSTTVVADPEAAATADKPYSFSLMSQVIAPAAQLNYGSKGTTFKTVNYVAGSYKLDKSDRVSVRQYFSYNRVPDQANKAVLNDPTLIWIHNSDGIMKSDPISTYMWYYVPTSEASRDLRSAGKLRMDVEFDWTLNPKWAVGYFMNPRQSFIPRQLVANKDEETAATEPFVEASSMTMLIHNAALYYTLSDKVTFYTTVGYTHIWKTRNMTLSDQSLDLALAGMFTLGKFQLVAEIDNSNDQVANYKKQNGKLAINENTLSYALQGAVSF